MKCAHVKCQRHGAASNTLHGKNIKVILELKLAQRDIVRTFSLCMMVYLANNLNITIQKILLNSVHISSIIAFTCKPMISAPDKKG